MLKRDVDEGNARLRQDLALVEQLSPHPDPPPLGLFDDGMHGQLAVDRDRPPVKHEHASRYAGEAIPGREEAATLVEKRGDEAAVDEARPALVTLVESEAGLVALDTLAFRWREVKPDPVLAAAETGRVVMRGDAQRIPPRSC